MDAVKRIKVEFDDGNSVELSIEEFREANDYFPEIVAAACEALARGETYRDGGGSGPAFTVSRVEPQPELPDIFDLVDAIRETVNAGDAYNAAHPGAAKTEDSPAGERWRKAFSQLRSLLSDCDKAMEAFAR